MTDHPPLTDEMDYLRPETYVGSYSRLGEPAVMLPIAERDVAFLNTALREAQAEVERLQREVERLRRMVRQAGEPQ